MYVPRTKLDSRPTQRSRRLLPRLLIGALLLAGGLLVAQQLSGPSYDTSWRPPATLTNDPTWLGLAHDGGASKYSRQVLVPPLHEVWQALIPGSLENPSMLMSLADNKLAVSSAGGAALLDAQSGKLLAERAKDIVSTQVRQHASLSLTGDYFYYVRGVDSKLNKQTLVAINNSTNAVAWQHELGSSASFVLSSEGDLVVAYTQDATPLPVNVVERLDDKTGALRWRSQPLTTSDQYEVFTTARYVYVQAVGGGVTKLDASSGASLGSKALSGKVLVNAEGIYVVGSSSVSYLKDWAMSQPAYSFSYAQIGYYIDAVLTTDAIYVIADRRQGPPDKYQYTMYKLGLDGKQEWAASFDDYQVNGVAGSNGLLYLQVQKDSLTGGGENRLLAINMANGKRVWQSANLGLPSSIKGANLFGGTQIVIGEGKLYMIYSQDYRSTEVHAFETTR